MQRYATVFFATGQWARPGHTPRPGRVLRLLRRNPARIYHWWLGVAVRFLQRSELAHVAISYDGAVLDPGVRGNTFWAHTLYYLYYPTLAYSVRVPVPHDIDLDLYHVGKPKRVWPTVLRFLTGNRWPRLFPREDCATVVIDCLRNGGVPVPLKIYQPQQLFRWLCDQGYAHVDCRWPADADCGSDPAVRQGNSAGHCAQP